MSGLAACRAIATTAILLTFLRPAFAQQRQSVEQLLLARAAGSTQLQPYFDLANWYYSVRRYDDFERTLILARSLIRQGQARAQNAPVITSGAPMPIGEPLRVGAGFAAPVRLREVRPIYPPEALQQRVGGTVALEITIDARGLVSGARITQSAAGLDSAALAAVRQWEFVPSFDNDKVVPVVTEVRLTFIPETVSTARPTWRRQVSTVLMEVARYANAGAHDQALQVLEAVLAASQRERTEPTIPESAVAEGSTTSEWPIRGGRDLKFPARLKDAKVMYPAEALRAHEGGIVAFHFVIDEQGKPTNLRKAVAPSPALEQAARDAIEQWEYTPTTIGGTVVPVAMTVTFAFEANRGLVEEVIRAGGTGEITEPKKIKHVPPRYPLEAQQRKLQGVVVIEAIIDRDGKVSSARVIRSAGDLLDSAALVAVRQWEFTPTRIYGEPVSVVMTVTASFTLN